MKHNLLSVANGLHTPPCGTSRSKSSNFILTSLLVFLMTFMGSGNACGSTNYFTPGKTIYFHVSGNCKNWGSNQFAVLFYYQNNENKAYGYENENYSARQFVGNSSIGSSNRIKCTRINDDYYSVVVPTDGTANIGYVRLIHLNTDEGWCHQAQKKVSADSFTGTNNCVAFSGWDDADPTGYEAYNSGECITSACGSGGGGDPEPDPDPEPEPEYDYTFTRGETMYFDLRNAAWYDGGACLYAEFFTENTSRGESSQLSETGTSHVYSFQIPNRNDITKIVINRYSPDNGGHAYKWGYTVDMTAEAAGTNNCIYMPSWTGNPVSCNWTKFSPYSLIGDYWLKNTNNDAGWFSPGDGPRFAYEGNGIYTLSYLVNVQAPSFTLVNHTTEVTDDKRDNTNSTSGFYNDFGSKKYKFNKITGTKKVTLTYTSSTDKLAAVYDNYDEKYTGWKLFVDGESALDMSDSGEKMVYLASGDHTFYITDGNATSYYGVNKFGGMYLSTSYTNHGVTITFPTQQYYDSNPALEHKFNIESSNYPTYPIAGLRNPAAKFSLSAAANVTFSFDGGTITLDAVAPAAPHTVTIHPDPENWEYAFPLVVPDGNTINSINASYGNQTNANWFTNAACTPGNEFILGTSTVDADMDLYAKWGVEGDFYLVGDFGMHDYETNWAYNSGMAMETEDGVASVTFIAPKGCNRFEILTERSSWPAIANQGSALIAPSTPTLHWGNGYGPDGYSHFYFELDAPKKVTVRYNGKVSITAEDYDVVKDGWTVASKSLFGHGSEESPDNADDGAYMNGYNMTEGQMNSDGELVIHNLNAGTYKFWIGKYNTALNKQKQNVEVFGAAHVDKDNSSLGDYGSLANVSDDTYNRSIPMDDKLHRRVKFTLNQRASIKIAFDGGKITVNLLPKYTVSFDSKGGSDVASQSVFEGAQASEPSAPTKAGYDFVKWQLSGADYSFSSAVTGNITLDAVWAYKAISGVSLNESEHTTWVGNSDFTLTPTLDPTDGITKSVVWSSNKESVATVSNGTVHAVAAGEARITITVTDQFDNVRTAYCDVTVAACEMTTDELYSMTVTGYNTSTGGSATLNGLWNQAVDNTEPASMTITRLAFQKKDVGSVLYAYDDNGIVKVKEDASGNDVQWILIPVGSSTVTPSWNSGNACQLYYIKSMATGKYMYRGSTGVSTGNADWYYSVTNTNTTIDTENLDAYQWFFINENDNQRCIFVKSGIGSTKAHSYKLHTSNQYNDCTDTYAAKPYLPVGCTGDINAYAKSYKNTNDFSYDTYNNPNYVLSQVNSSYYRMNTDATVQANLVAALVKGAIITVRLYADAATSVKLTKTDGTEIATINLSANAALDYTYTVNTVSALLGESAFVIKAADNHAAISSISVSRLHAVSPSTPDFTWNADLSAGITQSVLAGNIVHTASSTESLGAIFYTSSNPSVATVAADGTVTPIMAGTTTITALIEEAECYAERAITYDITLTEPTLAELIDADNGTGITLTHNYAEDVVIDKAVTINGGGYSIGNLTVENAGDLTLGSALTVNDFTLCAKAGNTSTPAESGQVRSANNLTVGGNAYFLYTVDPSGQVHYGWYDFTVPFRVNVMTGIKGIDEHGLNEDFVNERNYAIMEHLGEKQAAGEYAYKKFRGVMEPCRLYSITLDPQNNYNTIRFQKADGDLVAGNEVTLNTYASTVDDKHANWNGVGNGTLHHADAGLSVATIQVYQSGNKTFLPVERGQYSLVIGSAFMVQQAGTMTLNQATHSPLLAPKREASVQPTAIQIASEGQPFSDQLFISADETAGQSYTQGADVAKAGNIGNVNVPQIWTNAYNSKLCAHEAQLINGEAQYALSLYAPANGSYTLTSKNIPEGYTLYLTQNGNRIWDLSESYVLDLTKGTATEYGLLLVENYKMPTAIENIGSQADETQKIMRNGILYILRNGKVFNAQGAVMK